MILIWGRVLLKIGEAMRLLCCLLLGSSVLLSDADAQTTKASQDAATAIKKLGGKVQKNGFQDGEPVIGVFPRSTKVFVTQNQASR
jgi:hypothetical protein